MADTRTPKDKLLSRYGQLKTERATWLAHWKEITNYLLPRNGRYFVTDRDRGQKRHNNIYDSTGTRALRTLAAGLMGGLTSPARPWFRLTTSDPSLANYPPVKAWLADCTGLMLDIFQKSNTYRTLHSMYEELGGFGTAACIVYDDFDTVIHHQHCTVGEFAIATNWKGQVVTIYREFQKTVQELVREFGFVGQRFTPLGKPKEIDEGVSVTVKNLFDNGSLDQWITVMHAIEPREDRDASKIDAKNMPWKSCFFEIGGDQNRLLREGGFKRFPALVPRWALAGGDIYGNSPGMEALGDIKQLQHEQLRKANAIDYQTNPPLQGPTSLKNREQERFPGGFTYVDASTQTGSIKSLFDVNLNLQYLLQDIQDVRSRINGAFYADMFLMLSQQVDSRLTATEVAERHEEKMLMIGPVLERLQDECLNPLIDITFDAVVSAKLLPPPPPEIHGQQLSVELVSVLAQAQRAIATNGIDRFVGNLGQIAQFKPEVLDKFDSDKWADNYSDMLGVTPDIIVPDDQVAAIRQQRAQAQAKQQATEQAVQASQAAKNLGQTPTTGGNAASDLMNQFSGYGAGQQGV